MKMKCEYFAPQITVVDLDANDIVTISFDTEDNWAYDLFGADLPLRNRQ